MSTTQVPQYFICPITHNIMSEPYVDNEGNSYEEVAIKQWLMNNNTSPITRSPLHVSDLKLNRSLRDAIQAFLNPESINTQNEQEIKADFTIEENPIELKTSRNNNIVTVSVNPINGKVEVPNELVIVIDVSGSMNAAAYVEQDKRQIDVGFTILDITKHAIKTVIESLNNNDKISIVTFSDTAKVVCGMTNITNSNKTYLKSLVSNLRTEGCTNVWAGLSMGLKQFSNIENNNVCNKSLMFMTDGIPSEHLLPPRGIVESLNRSLKSMTIKPTIYTFGFGYSLDTKVLADIANSGNGTFSFIPDSGFVGTIIIHAMANIKTACGTNTNVKITTNGDTKIKKIYGYNNTNCVKLNTINYGQNKEFAIEFENDKPDYSIELEYNSYTNNITIVKAIKEDYKDNTDIIMRLEFVELLQKIIDTMPNKNTASIYINDYITKYNNNSLIVNDLKDQVIMAISTDAIYGKWGKNYLYSLMFAHKEQRCNNFKDKSVSVYGGTLFNELVDKIDEIYANMEPPKPSNQVRNCDVSTKSNGITKNPTTDSVLQFKQSFHNASGGCFHENSDVHVYPNNIKKCKEIVKGDMVLTNYNYSKVLCVIKIKCNNNISNMVMYNEGLTITPYHPIMCDEWRFPITLIDSEDVYCEYMYNFVLENKHIIVIGNTMCATLGHGFTDNDVIKHDYYGTDKVINDLKSFNGFDNGLITFDSNCIIRDNKNNVIAFDAKSVC
jgi:CRISPR/Cas system-associated exonuclease Cas4 (RecB family)